MKASLLVKLEELQERLQEVSNLLGAPEVIADQNRFRALAREYAELRPVVDCFSEYHRARDTIQTAREMLKDSDPEIRALASEELAMAEEQKSTLARELQRLLLPKDPADDSNVFLEIRAGTGGQEAALFSGDLFRMYARYADLRGWSMEIMSAHLGEQGGYKEVILRVVGQGAYSRLKFESGAHRVQRVPETESQGRIHTSACTVAIMPEQDEIEDVSINSSDLKIDTYRASGAGGQHVNKTDSAIRITHLPTNTVVECQDERSQHKNRARAMSLLRARLLVAEQERQTAEQAATRKSLVGSGDRSQRIRTYNFPQGRVTDHRINLTLYKLPEIQLGALDQVIDPLLGTFFPALDLVSRHPAALVRGLPIQEDPAGAPARGFEGAGLAGGLQGAGGSASAPAQVFELGVVGIGDVLGITQDTFGLVHHPLQALVFEVDGVAGCRLFVLGVVSGLHIGIQLLLEFLGADRRIGKDIRVGLQATDNFVGQGLDLGFGFRKLRHGKCSL